MFFTTNTDVITNSESSLIFLKTEESIITQLLAGI